MYYLSTSPRVRVIVERGPDDGRCDDRELPGSLSKKQIDFGTVLKVADRATIILAVVDKELNELKPSINSGDEKRKNGRMLLWVTLPSGGNGLSRHTGGTP